jgi:protein-L-isoaspartate(D-aspartate) O-methyltransferase
MIRIRHFWIFFGLGFFCHCAASQNESYEKKRESMVKYQIAGRGIEAPSILGAFRNIPRHIFVPDEMKPFAYEDRPLPIGQGQTISQPFIVAYMTYLARPEPQSRVLEIGTGSGYQAAILSQLCKEVFTIEIIYALAESSDSIFNMLGYNNIYRKRGDGYFGWPAYSPFDAILITAAIEEIPGTLADQIKEGGRLVAPVGPSNDVQYLTLFTKKGGTLHKENLIPVRFVPFTRE